MLSLLKGFQSDLEKVSNEISSLQTQSKSMGDKLKNRTELEKNLNHVLEGIFVTPDLVLKISEGEVNEFYVTHLQELNKKMTFVKAHNTEGILALKDVSIEMEKLRARASEKIQDFFFKKLDSLKSIYTNISAQQRVLLKYQPLFAFLLERYSEVAVELTNHYVFIVGQYYMSCFEKYVRLTQKIQTIVADRTDLLGSDESSNITRRTSNMYIFGGSTKFQLRDKSNVFSLGDRINILMNPDDMIILPQAAEDHNTKLPFEHIVQSIFRLLLDNACSEFVFVNEFFKPPMKKKKQLSNINPHAVFAQVFDPVFAYLATTLKTATDLNFDAISILICIRVISQSLRILQKRCIPELDPFLNAMHLELWPRFQTIMDMHVESVKKFPVSKVVSKDTHPHYIMRRYAEFAVSVLTLNQGYDDMLLVNSLQRLRTEVETLIYRMATEFHDKRARTVFYINNYDLVCSILSENNATNGFDALLKEKEYFQGLLDNKTAEYVEVELLPYFGNMIKFTNQVKYEKDAKNFDAEQYEKVVNELNQNWKTHLQTMNNSIISSFPNFQNGARVLHSMFTQLLMYYKSFVGYWEKKFENSKSRNQPVTVETVMLEIRKYRSNF